MTGNSHCPDVTLAEALKRLKLGGDMDMLVEMPHWPSKCVMQVRDDHLLVCLIGADSKPYSGKCHLTSELAVLRTLLHVCENAAHGGLKHVESR